MSVLPHFRDGSSVVDELRVLTNADIISASEGVLEFKRGEKRKRTNLLARIAVLEAGEQEVFRQAAAQKRSTGRRTSRKRPWIDAEETGEAVREATHEDEFLTLPPEDQVETMIAHFIDGTGNEALAMVICMVCATEKSRQGARLVNVADIPNQATLRPTVPHAAHVLHAGMLLHPAAIEGRTGSPAGHMCKECMSCLVKSKTPPLSLANGMWLGEIPPELKALTLPERILIARYYPAAYVVKLFPKVKGARSWSVRGLNSGVRGNVSTYKLCTDDIADIVGTSQLPPPARILASVIGVTIIGPRNLPERTMTGILRVRRARVEAALKWLQRNNPIYSHIHITSSHLAQLPEDGIPIEILGTAKYSDDAASVEKESAGYVPNEDEGEDDCGVLAGDVYDAEDTYQESGGNQGQ